MHARIAVAVAHVDLPVLRNGAIGGMVERRAEPGSVALAQPFQQGAVDGEDQHLVCVAIDDEDPIVPVDVDAVPVPDEAVPERANELAFPIQDDQGRRTALQDEERARAVDGDLADETQFGPLRQIAPGRVDPDTGNRPSRHGCCPSPIANPTANTCSRTRHHSAPRLPNGQTGIALARVPRAESCLVAQAQLQMAKSPDRTSQPEAGVPAGGGDSKGEEMNRHADIHD